MTDARSPAGLGAVFTRPWVVELILDLCGYTADADLVGGLAVEPAAGHGAFAVPMARRLVRSARAQGIDPASLEGNFVAYDLDPMAVDACRANTLAALVDEGVSRDIAKRLVEQWIREGDFLVEAQRLSTARWVVGNPPYVRLEAVERERMLQYRETWSTMSGRADVYVGFIEASLRILTEGGVVGFICADRWMRNQYGRSLREMLVNDAFAMDACIVMHDARAFDSKVSAYPAITVMRRGTQSEVLVSCPPASFDAEDAARIYSAWQGRDLTITPQDTDVAWAPSWYSSADGWPDSNPQQMATITSIEGRLPLLTETGVTIGVGVATGADKIYATKDPGAVESDRLLKIVSARETASGAVDWAGRYLVNPWIEEGLVDLTDFPGLKGYLDDHAKAIRARDVAKRNPQAWWRTLDRVHPSLASTHKLLIPDLKDRIFPVLDEGDYYPSHSLYHLTSDTWDLKVLGGLLMSDVATMFIEAYSVRMANGYLRVSAQYLRRVRVPDPTTIEASVKTGLRKAFAERNLAAANAMARRAYGLSDAP